MSKQFRLAPGYDDVEVGPALDERSPIRDGCGADPSPDQPLICRSTVATSQ